MENYKVLIAEDDEDIVEILNLYLSQNGFKVFTAINGKKALEIIENEKIDIALVDIMMPIMDGNELLKEFVKRVICLSLLFQLKIS